MRKPSGLPTPRPPPTMIRASSIGAAAPASVTESVTVTLGRSVTPSTDTISTLPATARRLCRDARGTDDDDAARAVERGVRHELAAERAHLDARRRVAQSTAAPLYRMGRSVRPTSMPATSLPSLEAPTSTKSGLRCAIKCRDARRHDGRNRPVVERLFRIHGEDGRDIFRNVAAGGACALAHEHRARHCHPMPRQAGAPDVASSSVSLVGAAIDELADGPDRGHQMSLREARKSTIWATATSAGSRTKVAPARSGGLVESSVLVVAARSSNRAGINAQVGQRSTRRPALTAPA